MAHNQSREANNLTRERSSSQQSDGSWGARASLLKNAKSDTSLHSENSPLLGESSSAGPELGRSDTVETWPGQLDFEGLPWWNKPSIYWLLPPFFLFALAFGGIIVPKLNLILSLVCRQYLAEKSANDPSFIFAPVNFGGDNPQCRQPEIQALATKFTLYTTIIAGVLSAIMSPKLGAWSDRYGRINFLIVTSAGGFLTEIITILAAKYPDHVDYTWLLLGSVFEGLCGSFTAGMALTHAYASDCTPPPKRAVAFGYFHACLFSGIALGPFIAAFTFKLTNSLLTMFYAALVIHACFVLFIWLFVPESLSRKRQTSAQEAYVAEEAIRDAQNSSWVSTVQQGNVLAPLKILWPTGHGSAHIRANLVLLSMVDTIIFGTAMGAMTVVVYYSGFQFGWGTYETNLFVSAANTARVSSLILILPLLNYLFRTRRRNKQRRESGFAVPEPNSGCDNFELYLIRSAIFFEILGFGGYALSRQGGLFALSGIFASFGGIGSPTLQSALTKHVPHDKVGQLLGATGLLHALARIVCPTIFNLIYAGTVGSFPQAVFVVLTCCFVLAFSVSWFIKPHVYVEESETNPLGGNSAAQQSAEEIIDEEIVGV
ncbi:MFS general substrate transporter-38 [Coleophoma crateriformis]|uniref:MFS general substrate transporter-38 n=1 Tax=Coleophoma crateriformis TaxID=565419 RepID=A0A3D8QRG1_9HELO|nr:MFS general substrate transporter-38 [Coleophoma crateriformis]